MSFRNLLLFAFVITLLALSCKRETIEFDYDYWYANQDSFPNVQAEELLVPIVGTELTFNLINMLDTSAPVKIVKWTWMNDTIIKGKTIHVLKCNTENLDILIPEKLSITLQNSGAYHYVKDYTYILYDVNLASNQADSTYSFWTVGQKKYLYSFNSPMNIGFFNGAKRWQIVSRIDSFAELGDIGKQAEITFTQTFGITEVMLSEILYSISVDTLSKYKFQRIN